LSWVRPKKRDNFDLLHLYWFRSNPRHAGGIEGSKARDQKSPGGTGGRKSAIERKGTDFLGSL